MRITLFLLIVLLIIPQKSIIAQENDSLALVALYNSTNGADWTNNSNWLTSANMGDWYGVTVAGGKITEVRLNNNNLTGTLPHAIGNFPALNVMDISGNEISGSLPTEIGNLGQLQELYINNNKLSGTIPTTIGNLSNLEKLWLQNNNFTGEIPQEIGLLTNLNDLQLFNTSISGSIPDIFNNMDQLQYISLVNNDLSGEIPGSIASSPILWNLNLSDNQLSGSIPSAIFNSTSVTQIALERNQLTGPLPENLGNCTNLWSLELNQNQLDGTIPASIGQLKNLDFCDFAENNLSGPIPAEIGGATSLRWFVANNNDLSGPLPVELGNITALEQLYLNNNNIDGDFPASVTGLANLISIFIHYNQLSGLPDLTASTSLTNLIVNNNRLTFEDIEPNISFTSKNFQYQKQDSVGEEIDSTINAGSPYSFSVNVGGNNNLYQWFKGSKELSGETGTSLNLLSAVVADSGSYHCKITNSVATALSLFSRPVHLSIVDQPYVTTNNANDINISTATLRGTVNANGLKTVVEFIWSINSDLTAAKSIELPDTLSSYKDQIVSTGIDNLLDETTYYFRVRATNNLGSKAGSIESFVTLPNGSIPTVITKEASNITFSSATLNGIVNPNGLESNVEFQWGLKSDLSDATTKAAEQNPINGIEEQAVTYTVNGLQAEQTYYYRTSATNSKGTGDGPILFFTTISTGITANTLEPAEISARGGQLRGLINPNDLTVSALFQWSTDLSYNNTVTSDQNQVAGTDDITVTSSLGSLTSNTQYNYRVIAVVGTDTTFGQSQILHTWHGPVMLVSPANESNDVGVKVNLYWNEVAGASLYQIQVSSDETFASTLIDQTVESLSFEAQLAYGTTFYWRVAVFDRGITHTWSPVWSLSTIGFPAQINASTLLSFPLKTNVNEFAATDYRLFGLPGDADMSLTELFGSNENKEWITYWDNGQEGSSKDYLEAYSDNNTFRFITGRAFWIIFNGSRQINQQINNAPLIDGNEVSVPLHSGWNLITNPFNATVDWNIVQTHNGITEPVHDFSGSFNTTAELQTYSGYYFFNEPNLAMSSIFIPIAAISSTFPKIAAGEKSLSWDARLIIQTDDNITSSVRLGISELARKGQDSFDYHKPGTSQEIPAIYFSRPDWDDTYSAFASDIRPVINKFEKWAFSVNPAGRKTIKLSLAEARNIPSEYDIILVDRTRRKIIDCRQDAYYTFTGLSNSSQFELLVGNSADMEEELANILPKTFSVGANYPNPFNPRTTIPLSVSEPVNIELSIFDVNGKIVKQLHKGLLEPGKHYFTWDGSNFNQVKLSSGVYFCRVLKEGKKASVRKLILLK